MKLYGADCPQAPERKLFDSTFLKTFWINILWKGEMNVSLLARDAITLAIFMPQERVVLRVLMMFSKLTDAKSTNSLVERLVLEMKIKLENEMRPTSDMLLN